MLNASSVGSRSSLLAELICGIAIIAAVGLGVYEIQNPDLTQQQRIQAAFE
jgi:hypothetical protein